jgi:CRISPR-associated protein Csa1
LFKALEDFRRFVYAGVPMSGPGEAVPEEFKPKAEALYRYVAARLLGEYHYVLASGLARGRDSAAFYAAPIHTQVAVDGAPLGLGHVSPASHLHLGPPYVHKPQVAPRLAPSTIFLAFS